MTQDPAALRRMKLIALALLAGAAALYALAVSQQGQHPAWPYVAAFGEAAMVGAVADWFAVTALFRHPLGLPIPHTAIIPNNQLRIGQNLAGFICAHFLGTQQVLDKLREWGVAARTARWLADPAHAATLAEHATRALRYLLDAFDDERVRAFIRHAVLDRLAQLDVASLGSGLLQALTHDGRHQAVLDGALRKLAALLQDEAVQQRVAEAVAAEVHYLRLLGLDQLAGRYASRKLVAGIVRLIDEMAADAAHPLRARFDEFVQTYVARLKEDPALRAQVETLKAEVLASPALAQYLQGLWGDIVEWVRADLAREDSVLRGRVAAAIERIGRTLEADAAMQAWIDEQLMEYAPRWIERYREDIRRYIVARVAAWNTGEMTRELERNIGRDLQFIRVNGTLVGGLVGLAIHSVTLWIAPSG